MSKEFRIATRGSPLALWQAEYVKGRLERMHPDLNVRLVRIQTRGDKILDTALAHVGGKGLFVKELEDALLRGEADLAVHSMKDVPVDLPDNLVIAAVTAREDPRDALVSSYARSLDELRLGARVGTSSLRRQSQLLEKRPDLETVTLRGNVDTRLNRMEAVYLDGIVLAAAGLKRLGLEHRISHVFSSDEMIPAIGQGALGLEVREDDKETRKRISAFNHPDTETEVRAERAFLRTLEGGCQVPIAAKATCRNGILDMTGLVSELDGSRVIRSRVSGPREHSVPLGVQLAKTLLEGGARGILERLYDRAP